MKPSKLWLAATALAATLLGVAPALAVPAQATVSLNVRAGASTSYAVVDVLYAGETVDVSGCQSGWCAVTHDGPDGYVSQNYLRFSANPTPPPAPPAPPVQQQPVQQQPEVGFCIDAPNFSFGVNCDPDEPDPAPAPTVGPACFYEGRNFNGQGFCAERGTTYRQLSAWNDRINSVRLTGGARVVVCTDAGLSGSCAQLSNSLNSVGAQYANTISSIRVD